MLLQRASFASTFATATALGAGFSVGATLVCVVATGGSETAFFRLQQVQRLMHYHCQSHVQIV